MYSPVGARNLTPWCEEYDALAASGIFTADEERELRQFFMLMGHLHRTRDFMNWNYGSRNANFEADRVDVVGGARPSRRQARRGVERGIGGQRTGQRHGAAADREVHAGLEAQRVEARGLAQLQGLHARRAEGQRRAGVVVRELRPPAARDPAGDRLGDPGGWPHR